MAVGRVVAAGRVVSQLPSDRDPYLDSHFESRKHRSVTMRHKRFDGVFAPIGGQRTDEMKFQRAKKKIFFPEKIFFRVTGIVPFTMRHDLPWRSSVQTGH